MLQAAPGADKADAMLDREKTRRTKQKVENFQQGMNSLDEMLTQLLHVNQKLRQQCDQHEKRAARKAAQVVLLEEECRKCSIRGRDVVSRRESRRSAAIRIPIRGGGSG